MILYSPLNSEVLTDPFRFEPKSCFVMAPLGKNTSKNIEDMRKSLSKKLEERGIKEIDALDSITGGDYLDKIWKQILASPFGIALIEKDIPLQTFGNIFYELGIFDTLGKYSVVIKTKDLEIPSDFKRTEYISFDKNFSQNIDKFIDTVFEQAEHYFLMAETFQNTKPLLAIDYLRRSYLITGDSDCLQFTKKIFEENKEKIDEHHQMFIRRFIKG